MKPPRFHYFDPTTADEALELLAVHGDEAKILAGGQSLMPLLSMRLAYPSSVIDINNVAELSCLDVNGATLRVGALVRHADIEDSDEARTAAPLLSKAMRWIGHRSIRHRGTVGGSLAHADPAAEIPAVMTALDATVEAVSHNGAREIPIGDLFEMPLVSTLAPDELLTAVRIRCHPPSEGSAVVEVARRHGDFALAGIAATVALAPDGTLGDVRLASFATAPTPVRLRDTEAALAGGRPESELLEHAGRVASAEIAPTDDLHASAAYRRAVTAVLVGRAVTEAADDARDRAADGL